MGNASSSSLGVFPTNFRSDAPRANEGIGKVVRLAGTALVRLAGTALVRLAGTARRYPPPLEMVG